MSDSDGLFVEIIICYKDKTWETKMVEIPEPLWTSQDSDNVSHYCYNNIEIMSDSIQFIGVYSWAD